VPYVFLCALLPIAPALSNYWSIKVDCSEPYEMIAGQRRSDTCIPKA
jgi:hypothetical protein